MKASGEKEGEGADGKKKGSAHGTVKAYIDPGKYICEYNAKYNAKYEVPKVIRKKGRRRRRWRKERF